MDALYGQKALAEFCQFVVASLFELAQPAPAAAAVPAPRLSRSSSPGPASSTSTIAGGPAHGLEGVDTPPYTPPLSSSSSRVDPPALLEFIAYALYRTRLPLPIVQQALLLLSRLKQRYPAARGTSSSPHRLFLSALMLSAKISMDDTYSNKSWAIVGYNYFALKEINQMERELFAFLGWNVVVSLEELTAFVEAAEASWSSLLRERKQDSSKRRRVQEEADREARHQQAKNAARALLRPHTYRHPSPTIPSKTMMQSSVPSSASGSPSSSSSAAKHHSYSLRSSSHRSAPTASSSSSSLPPAATPSSCNSSAPSSSASSAFPSAVHSPSSPPSAPLSAGPQTPASQDCARMAHHCSVTVLSRPRSEEALHIMAASNSSDRRSGGHGMVPDFPEAAGYMDKKAASSSSSSASSALAALS